MGIKFARFNIQLLEGPDAEVKADQWQEWYEVQKIIFEGAGK